MVIIGIIMPKKHSVKNATIPRRLRCATGTTTKLTAASDFFLAASGVYAHNIVTAVYNVCDIPLPFNVCFQFLSLLQIHKHFFAGD